MDIKNEIEKNLWDAIKDSYEKNNFRHAVIDTFHYLTEKIREKTGIDGDGERLIGQSFGGESPKLKVNKYQTQSEKDEQKGITQILLGMYKGIRNPRSHEIISDDKKTADSIIIFIDFLLKIIGTSTQMFTIDDCLTRFFDSNFNPTKRYVELLVQEIPLNKRYDVLIEIFRQRKNGEWKNLKLIVDRLVKNLNEDELDNFLFYISEELKTSNDEIGILKVLQIFPMELWERIKEIAKLRIERLFINKLEKAELDFWEKTNKEGSFGTWVISILDKVIQKEEFYSIFIKKLKSNDSLQYEYIFEFFLPYLDSVVESDYDEHEMKQKICELVKEDKGKCREKFIENFYSFSKSWQKSFRNELNEINDPEFWEKIEENHIPF